MTTRFRVLAPAAALFFVLGGGAASATPSGACPLISLAAAEAIYGKPFSAGVEVPPPSGSFPPGLCYFAEPNANLPSIDGPGTIGLEVEPAVGGGWGRRD